MPEVLAVNCGYLGSVSVGSAGNLGYEWTVDLTGDNHDVTIFGSSWHQFVQCLKGCSGSFKSYTYANVLGTQTATFDAGSGGAHITGTILVKSIKPSVDSKGVISYEYAFDFTGEVTG